MQELNRNAFHLCHHLQMLSKLVCGLNKPRKQSVLPHDFVNVLFRDLPIVKVRGLGGKLGASVAEGLMLSIWGPPAIL
ncbi:putative DNA polymerase eta [Apostichopus japonicus]|uniref:Putative DNA polymerase eta n=1 Tax=Stichopus japonicus TaxID=307972 RepID=A0A2G8L9I1_STIJA|nr:putative DNA polymerase eta [Apostichopus japonicus]